MRFPTQFLTVFSRESDGAVSTEWVVLTVAATALGVLAVGLVLSGTNSVAENSTDQLADAMEQAADNG